MIKEINDTKEPIIDSYGRVTFFYVVMANEVLPIYQPGSIMFESAVNEESDISITAHGS